MESKEALAHLFNEANRFDNEKSHYSTYELCEFVACIQKDLKELETLKEKK